MPKPRPASFAVQEVVRDLGNIACIHTNSETSSLTADPKIRAPTAFRVARQGVHDAVAGSIHLAEYANAKKLNKWATCSPDYAYGRDTTAQYLQFFKQFKPDVEVITDAWPKLGQPDFTEVITKLIQAKPQALFTLLYAGDLSAFVNQGNVYALFSQMTVATPNRRLSGAGRHQEPAGRHPVGDALPGNLPGYARQQGMGPGLPQALERAADQLVVAAVGGDAFLRGKPSRRPTRLTPRRWPTRSRGMKINTPFGADGTITMRDDHTTIGYAIGWGQTTPQEPFIIDVKPADWGKIIELETEWKKQKNYI